ncbi:ABC transporter substrate-binding protein [Tengunoibacter tsumagoiensis]|uniref:Sugar ABC transporter substrate-binding protein n=1 Tax=Tengunoibacter tsumagoiensis TaxID=2014871 RepID=A0A402A6F1_9CHLR|nr:ABC transporter substrate-binding protein [Tengunoibacter tsumagoiensis]GCE14714.1 sugar ABC transporter substrate-binding protein [Tengunoibacter tsumagoiensis]
MIRPAHDKRKLTASLALLMLFLASCTPFPPAPSSGKIPLTLWYWTRSIDDALLARVEQHFPQIHLQAIKIGGPFDTKLRTVLAGQTAVPDIVAINSNIATYFPDDDQFVDLYTLGAGRLASQYLTWKWKQGETPSGHLIGFPMDTGPTALFYRTDLFQKAGLPTDPTQVSARMASWDDYIQAAQKMQQSTHGQSFMFNDIGSTFNLILGQMGKRFFAPSGQYIGDQEHIRTAWDLALRVHQLDLSAKISNGTTDWSAAVSNGTLASFVGAVWTKKRLLDSAKNTKGLWRVARAPGGDGNDGGSFLAITKASPHPREAFQVLSWLLSPASQLQAYLDLGIFPSAPADLTSTKMFRPETFYGGQITTKIFTESAKNVVPGYIGPNNDLVSTLFQQELSLIETQNSDSQTAWNDVQQQIARELTH